MGKAKKTRKFAEVKRLLNPKDARLVHKEDEKVRNVLPPSRCSYLWLSDSSLPPYTGKCAPWN